MRILIALLLSLSLMAESTLPSPLPLPAQEIYILDTESCDERCINELYISGHLFSFIGRTINNKAYEQKANEAKSLLGLSMLISGEEIFISLVDINQTIKIAQELIMQPKADGYIKVAVLLPKKSIGRYAITTTRAILSYLISRDVRFQLETFDIEDESIDSIAKALDAINQGGYSGLLAILTKEGAGNISQLSLSMKIYIPTVSAQDMAIKNPNAVYGGIDYGVQVAKISRYTNDRIGVFYDDTPVAQALNRAVSQQYSSLVFQEELKSTDKKILEKTFDARKFLIKNSSIFLNSQMIKSSLALSMLTYYENKPHGVFGLQHLYNPLIFSLTQEKDRELLYLANSIIPKSSLLAESAYLAGSELKYDWINYSCNIGIDYLFTEQNRDVQRLFDEQIMDGRVIYDTEILKVQKNSFEKLP